MAASWIWGTDLEIFAAALLCNIDIWVYLGYSVSKWQLFSKLGFDLSNAYESPSKEGIYLRLQDNHYCPILDIKYDPSSGDCICYDNGSTLKI